MKKKAIALALSLTLMLSIFVPGTLAMGTESGKDATIASQQASVPQKTETPSEAVDSAEPSDPSEPVKPVEPNDPSTPAEEGKPVETTAPTDGNKPEETTAPTDGNKPEETTAPTEESKSEETTAPTEESKPTDIMPQIMSMIQQDILAGEPEMIDAKWFSFVGADEPGNFVGVQSGHISRNTVPEIPGHVYAGAYYHNAQVDIIGQITYQDQAYVYFVPVGGNTELVSQVLTEGEKIELRYTETPLNISYTVTVDGTPLPVNEDGSIVMDGIPYGGSTSQKVTVISAGSPHAVTPNGEFSFGVEIPRGYTATVSVNNTPDSVKLGVSPEYTLDGDTIVKNGEYLTSHTYTANATDNGEQSVTVALTTDNTHTFSADLISKTKYFTDDKGNPGDRIYQSNIGDSVLEDVKNFSGTVSGDQVTWNFETNRNKEGPVLWYLDSLQINGTDITVPFANGVSKSTTLPSGAVVTVTREEHDETYGWFNQYRGYRHYAYTITITNVHEDIVVTGGNLCGTSHNEYMPYAFTGVGVLEYQNGGGWEPMSIAQPVAADQITSGNFRFTLKGGYGAPTFTVNDHEYPATLNIDGYYYVNNVNPSSYPALIVVDSKEVEVKVEYVAGEVTGAENLPTDGNTYSLAEGYPHEITIPLRTPTDPTGKMVFAGWENNGETYQRNAVVSLIDTDERDGVVTFTAKWIDAATADYVTYHIHYVDSDTDKTVAESAVSQALKNTAVILNVEQGSIHTWLMNNPQYEVDNNRTQFYYEKIDNNDILNLYVKEKTAQITYQAVGPKDATRFGSVTLPSEDVKISSGTAQGSTPVAEAGFRFVGWYTDADCTMEVEKTWVAEGTNKLTPVKPENEMWEAATYYAKFDYAYADLTITATGIANTYGQQGTIYQVNVKPADGTPEFNFQIAINGNGTKKITDLPYGEYTVTPQNNWSWRYSDQTSKMEKPVEGNDGRMVASFTFDYTLVDQKWLSGNAYSGN